MKTLLFISTLLFTGCNENEFHEVNDVGAGNGVEIEVSPSSIYFGDLLEGESRVEVFTVMSVGQNTLEVSDITISSETGSFTLVVNQDSEFSLEPGDTKDIAVVFTPLGGNDLTAEAYVHSNDQLLPEATVMLMGTGLVPMLQISPDPYDFGTSYIGCPTEGDIELSNVGAEVLIIDDINISDPNFNISWSDPLPLSINPGESILANLSFDPYDEVTYNSVLSVTSNEPIVVREANQSGEGLFAAWYTDTWDLDDEPASDIVFLVDQSCSMSDEASRLASNFSYFINELNQYTTDWRIMVVNDDNGCHRSGVLTPSSGNYQSAFTNAVQSGGGSHTESLLTLAASSIDQTDPNECNQGFMRPNAMLHMVMVSDEPEQSSGSWSTYVDRIIAKKGTSSLVRLSSIAGDYPGGCSGADPGSGYYEAASYTGGAFLSICANSWASYMAILADASISQDTFVLSSPAAEQTIEVFVDGNPRAGNWTFDAGANAVIFTADIPEGGHVIDISYAALVTCD
jgi:hypothetical protein